MWSGITLTIDQQTRLVGFVAQLTAHEQVPEDADRLASLITPLIATTPLQQSQCRDLLLDFVKPRLLPNPKPSPPEKDPVENPSIWRLQFSLARFLKAVAFAVIISATLIAIIWYFPWPSTHHPFPNPGGTNSGKVLDIPEWVKNYPIKELELPKQSPLNRSWRWFYTEYTPAKWAAAIVPWIIYAGVMVWLFSLLLAYLRREAIRRNLNSIDLHLNKVSAPFGDRRLLAALQPLRRLPQDFRAVLNAERTAKESAKTGGSCNQRLTKSQFRKTL